MTLIIVSLCTCIAYFSAIFQIPYFKDTNLNKLTYDHIFEFREYLKTKPKKQNENEVLSYNTINKVQVSRITYPLLLQSQIVFLLILQ